MIGWSKNRPIRGYPLGNLRKEQHARSHFGVAHMLKSESSEAWLELPTSHLSRFTASAWEVPRMVRR